MTSDNDDPENLDQDSDNFAPSEADAKAEALGPVPDLIRRFAALGLSGFFTTESALRKALGDTVPKEWMDFAADQSERTRTEMMERLSVEIGRMIENVNLSDVLASLLEGRTIEVNAKIRLAPREAAAAAAHPGDTNDTTGRMGARESSSEPPSLGEPAEEQGRGAIAISTRDGEIKFKIAAD